MFRPVKSIWPVVAKSMALNIKVKPPMPHIQSRFVLPCISFRSMTSSAADHKIDTVLGTTAEEKQDLWKTYLDRIERRDPTLAATDFLDIAKVTIYNNFIEQQDIIARLQTILRDIHRNISTSSDPEMARVFVRTCNMLMKAFIINDDLSSARLVLDGLINTGHTITDITISTILYGIAHQGTKTDVYQLVDLLQEKGVFVKNAHVYSRLINTLRRLGDYRGCRYYFGVMQEKHMEIDAGCYKTMIEVYKEQPDMMLELFNEMKRKGFTPVPAIYSIILSELVKHRPKRQLAKQLFEEVKHSGQQLNVGIYLIMGYDPINAMVDMKTAGMEFQLRDYNTCLSYYVKKNQFPKALDVFRMMSKNNIRTDHYSYSILIDALAKDIETPPEAVFDLYECMKLQGLQPDTTLYTSLISVCSRSQDLEKAMHLLEEMEKYHVMPNIFTFNSILGLMARMDNTSTLDLDRASLVWSKMTAMNIHPDTRTFNVYLSIIAKLTKPASAPTADLPSLWDDDEQDRAPRTVKEMLRMYRHMKQNHHPKMQPDFLTYTIVINALSSAGQLRSAMQVYDDAKLSHIVLPVSAYNTVMVSLQRGGKVSEAMNVWHDMRIQQVLPDSTTYEIVLEGCEQLGLTETIKSVRNQRKADFERLLELDKQKENRIKK